MSRIQEARERWQRKFKLDWKNQKAAEAKQRAEQFRGPLSLFVKRKPK
jgi:hypothetical protein